MLKYVFFIIFVALIQINKAEKFASECDSAHSTVCDLLKGTLACCPVKDGVCCKNAEFCCPKGKFCKYKLS